MTDIIRGGSGLAFLHASVEAFKSRVDVALGGHGLVLDLAVLGLLFDLIFSNLKRFYNSSISQGKLFDRSLELPQTQQGVCLAQHSIRLLVLL